MKRHKNVYMGPDSTAGIFVQGHVDQYWEILANAYATAFDVLDGQMLTRTPGKFDPATEKEIAGRFFVLKRLAYKNDPRILPAVDALENLSFAYIRGDLSSADFLSSIRFVARKFGLSDEFISYIESRIMAASLHQPADLVRKLFGLG